jgi:outer membrane immunogenic protein
VLGLEADLDWAGLTGSSSVAACGAIGATAGAACQTKSDWLSTARGRVGYAFDRILVFATGGLALTNLQLVLTQTGSGNDVIAGWTIGAGVEFAFADNWTAKAEYLFADFGTTKCFSQSICPTAGVSLSENIIRGGINYKFYW